MVTINIHSVLTQRKYNCWREIESEIENIPQTVEKGNAFEQFCYFYLCFFNVMYQIAEVFSDKVPGRSIPAALKTELRLSDRDDGVDGVYIMTDGRKAAYQAKFRSMRHSPTSNELNNFWAEAEYADSRMIIANANSLPSDVEKRKNTSFVLGYLFDELPPEFFDYLYEHAAHTKSVPIYVHEKFTPRSYQDDMIEAAITGFRTHHRGKIIAACATGKTLVALWISERLRSRTVLFFAPSLALIRQTIQKWTVNANERFAYLAVCSDITVNVDIDDSFTINLNELDIPITTDPREIAAFLTAPTASKKVVFSTYQSVDSIIAACAACGNFAFDFAVYDEAHRTAGANTGLFGRALENSNINVDKRLFMTATERLVRPWIKERFEQQNRVVFSMDDYSKYGPVFYRLPFGKAIQQGIIADYQIVVAMMTNSELANLVTRNRFLTLEKDDESIAENVLAQLVFKVALFTKIMDAVGATKAVSFHSSVLAARDFCSLVEQWPTLPEGAYISHVNGTYSAARRAEVFSTFEDAPFGLISNVRCLTEGVDIPYIDAIIFADPRNSLIDIVQAVGRALRKPFGIEEKTSYIIIPVLVDESTGQFQDDAFSTMHSVIQALRDQDETFADWIDTINLGVVKGTSGRTIVGGTGRIRIILSEKIDVDEFYDSIAARISEFNSRPTGAVALGSTLGRNERGSSWKRMFKTFCDYNYRALKDSLVDPTLALFTMPGEIHRRHEIVINNNNVSHTERLGLIAQRERNIFFLTPLGVQYKNGEVTYSNLFSRQILLYQSSRGTDIFYPYRAACQILLHVGTLNYIEFLYGIYTLSTPCDNRAIEQAIQIILLVREAYPNVMQTSAGNQEEVRTTLNSVVSVDFSERDVWTDRTTTGNQYRFFLNHISLLDNCFDIDYDMKSITAAYTEPLTALLEVTEAVLNSPNYDFTGRM